MSVQASEPSTLVQLSSSKQQRMNILMDLNSEGAISTDEYQELKRLVQESQEITMANSNLLAAYHGLIVPE